MIETSLSARESGLTRLLILDAFEGDAFLRFALHSSGRLNVKPMHLKTAAQMATA
jgi:hypothetical protein